jgi:hypothetical protein
MWIYFGALLMLLSLSTAGCAPVVASGPNGGGGGGTQGGSFPSNPPSHVGILEVSGPQVFVDGTGAQSGQAIYNGNQVTTGAGSSGLIDLDLGGTLQLDENTDPVFKFQLLKEGWCLVVNIVSGQIFDDTHSGSCVQINTPDGSGVVASSVNVHVGGSGSSWTVVQGQVRLLRPAGAVIQPYDSVMVRKGRIVSTRRLSSDELARLIEWRSKYRFRPVRIPRPPSGHPPVTTVPIPPPSYKPPPPYKTPVSSVPPPSSPPPASYKPPPSSTGIIGRMRGPMPPAAVTTPSPPSIK